MAHHSLDRPQHSLLIATVRQIPIYVHYSWALACLLIGWSLAQSYYPEVSPLPLAPHASTLMAIGTIPLMFFCIALHELAHAITASHFGIPVRYIVLMLFGGTAMYAREATTPEHEAKIAAAGPLMSLVLAIGFAILNQSAPSEPVQATMLLLMITNTGLAAFNLFPCYPMDGGRLLHALIWTLSKSQVTATRWAVTLGRALSTTLVSLGIYIWLVTTAASGIWLAFLGAFLYNAAETSQNPECHA